MHAARQFIRCGTLVRIVLIRQGMPGWLEDSVGC